eukprot:8550399-Pyramimonas_sp.AAC.1
MAEAIDHMDTCVRMHNEQLDKGRYFLHEAPHSARSWHVKGIQDLLCRNDVFHIINDQCEAGQTVPAKQPDGTTRNMT